MLAVGVIIYDQQEHAMPVLVDRQLKFCIISCLFEAEELLRMVKCALRKAKKVLTNVL